MALSLDLLLSVPGVDHDTERRATWLRQRLTEIAPDCAPPVRLGVLDATRLHLEQVLLTA